jgi:hypothetical protein
MKEALLCLLVPMQEQVEGAVFGSYPVNYNAFYRFAERLSNCLYIESLYIFLFEFKR